MIREKARVGLWLGVFAAGAVSGLVALPAGRRVAAVLDQHSADPPQPLSAPLWASRVGQFRTLDARVAQPSVVYVGDSITAWVNLEEYLEYENGRVLNRAIAGDTTSGVLRRVQATFPEDVEVCLLLVGYNDLAQGEPPESVAGRILAIRDYLMDSCDVAHVVVESLIPAATEAGTQIDRLNDSLRRARREGASFLDLHSHFLRDGHRDAGLYADDVHLNAEGILRRMRLELEHLRSHGLALCDEIRIVPDERD